MLALLSNHDALLVTNPVNIEYLTGFVSVAPEAREAYLLLTKNKTILFTNSLYTEQAKQLSNNPIIKLSNSQIKMLEVVEISRDNPFSKQLAQFCKTNKLKRLGFEETDVTVSEFVNLKKELTNTTLIPTRGRVEELRMIKNNDEIASIRRAAKLTDQCFDSILKRIEPGATEASIAWEIESYIRRLGGQLAFSPIVAFGSHSSQPHYQASGVSGSKCQEHDLILLDFGARINGYCSDMSRVVFIGKPKDEWKKTYEVVLHAQQTALATLSPTISGAQLDRIARTIIEKAGLPAYPHSLGHGVGLQIHEAPRLTIKKDAELLSDIVVTVEPAVYIEGQYGIRIEDLVLLTKDGVEILSHSPKEIITL